jgi:flagellar hook protein FlgE
MIEGGTVGLGEADAIKASGLYLSRVGKFGVDGNGYLIDDAGNYVYGFQRVGYLLDSTFDTTALVPLKLPTKADMAGLSNKEAGDLVAKYKKELEDARAMLDSMNVELGSARNTYMEAEARYKAAYNAVNGGAGIDAAKADLDTAKKDMDDAYRAWVDIKDDPNKTDAEKTSAKNDYDTAKIDYDKANAALIVAQAEVRKVSVDPNALADLQAAVSDYVTKYQAYILADPTDPGYEQIKTDYTAAKKTLETLEADLSKIDDASAEGLRDSAKQAVRAAEAKVTAAEKTVSDAEANLATAQNSETTTVVNNAGADDSLAEITNYEIQKDGTVVGTSKDGVTVIIGQIALAGIQNTNGLEKDSGYYYSIGPNAGNVSVYVAGGSEGRILGNYLELSKTDLATEMTDMITTQRGFQANSKIITVTDQMLEELVNMKR